jgi:hypothetical protein
MQETCGLIWRFRQFLTAILHPHAFPASHVFFPEPDTDFMFRKILSVETSVVRRRVHVQHDVVELELIRALSPGRLRPVEIRKELRLK